MLDHELQTDARNSSEEREVRADREQNWQQHRSQSDTWKGQPQPCHSEKAQAAPAMMTAQRLIFHKYTEGA